MKYIMKHIAYVIALILCATNISLAQTYSDESTTDIQEERVRLNEQLSPNTLIGLGIFNATNPRSAALNSRKVSLTQVGDFNTVSLQVSADASDIKLTQNGDSNFADLRYRVKTVISDLEQNGSFNQIRDFVNSPNADVSLLLKQDGDYLNFQREGVNNLTKSLKLTQSDGTPSLIIRSIN